MVLAESEADTPGTIAYRELVYEHAGTLIGYLYMLTGNATVAAEVSFAAFRRVWDSFRKGEIIGDAEDQLYRYATRDALRRMQRADDTRGHLPTTTAPEHEIVAAGVTSGFQPQQRAAILMTVWGDRPYRVSGVASGIGGD